jgi:PIN domain nuclease of toxin-antitoxin system
MLLDTCVLLWLATAQVHLSPRARALIGAHASELFVSAISAFELSLKHARGRLVLPLEPEVWFETALAQHGIEALPVDWRIAARSAALPFHHADPADRILVATALQRGLTLLSPDSLLRSYGGLRVEW